MNGEEVKPRADAPHGMEFFTVEIILDGYGRYDLLKRLHEEDITVFPEIRKLLKKNFKTDIINIEDDSGELADGYITIIQQKWGLLPGTIEDIPQVLEKIKRILSEDEKKEIDVLSELYKGDEIEDIPKILNASQQFLLREGIIARVVGECINVMIENSDFTPDLENEDVVDLYGSMCYES